MAQPVQLEPLFIALFLVLLALVLRMIRKASRASKEVTAETVQKPEIRPVLRPFAVAFLAIMGTIICFSTIYSVVKLMEMGFSKLPLELQLIWILIILVSFSSGLTEIAVAWLLHRTMTKEETS